MPPEVDFNFISRKKRNFLPRATLRAIPFVGILLGCLIAFFLQGIFPQITHVLYLGSTLGGILGVIAYQYIAHHYSTQNEIA